MSQPQFINLESSTTTGALGALPRAMVLVSRETVTGFSPAAKTGLIKINSTDLETFSAENDTSYGLINALITMFEQNYTYDSVYILSTNGSSLTTAMLDKANRDPRSWSFLTLVSQYQGGGNSGSDAATYFADLGVMATWATPTKQKIVVHTYSVEQDGDDPIELPATLQLGGSINSNKNVKTIVSNSQHIIGDASYITTYDNIAIAWVAYCINSAVSRSWGSLSDAHDFAYVLSDTYSSSSQSVIANNSLAQYNGEKDRAGSVFVYDTQMNDKLNPPLTDQIETLAAGYYIQDYIYVLVHNTFQAGGQLGLPTDDAGIQAVSGVVNQGLRDCTDLNLILLKDDGSPDYSIRTLTATQVTVLSPNWKTTGVWPSGVITATVKRFAADHYITLNFAF